MRLKMRVAAVAVLSLLVGALAAPASAQDAEIAGLEDCFAAFQVSPFGDLLPEDVDTAGEFELWVIDQDLLVAEVCEIGGTYVPEVAGEIVQEPGPKPKPEVVLPVTRRVDPPAPKVLGQILAVTGIDAAILTLAGLSLVGLGVVAVRGTRRRPSES